MPAGKKDFDWIELIIFDWDGFLAKSLHVWLDAFQDAYSKYNLVPNNSEISSRFGHWEQAYNLTKPLDIKELNETARTKAIPQLKNVELYDGAKDTLKLVSSLRSAGKLSGAVLWTGSHHDAIQNPLNYHSIAEMFDLIITSSDPISPKPSSDAISYATKHLGLKVQPGQVVIFGDTDNDVLSAKRFGARSVLFLPEDNHKIYGSEQVASFRKLEPDYTVYSHDEVQKLLLNLTSY